MRPRRLLLAATALSTMAGCTKARTSEPKDAERIPLPGNPKGTFYDAAAVAPPDAATVAPLDAIGMPANPKGSFYDAGLAPKPDATPAPPDAKPPPPRDAGPKINPLPGNPKGSHYDKGSNKDPLGL